MTDAWPTPDAGVFGLPHDPDKFEAWRSEVKAKGINGNGMGTPLAVKAQQMMRGSTWPTPVAADSGVKVTLTTTQGACLLREAATWATPATRDWKGGTLAKTKGGRDLATDVATLWSTPSVADVTGGRTSRSGDRKGELLLNSMAAYVAQNAWPTPTSLNRPRNEDTLEKCGAYRKAKAGQNTVPLYLEEVALASSLPAPPTETPGPISPGIDPTSCRPSLNPAFVEWMMGWPPGWTSFACSETGWSRFRADMRSALSQLTSHAAPPAQLSLFG